MRKVPIILALIAVISTTATPYVRSVSHAAPLGASPSRIGIVPDSCRSSERLYNLPGLENTGRVTPGIFRGAQPGKAGYATLKRMGIRTVIDLRTTESEKQQVESFGMKAIAIPIAMSRNGLKEKVDRVVALMADPANQPVYVHCRHGQDRTGIVVAAYRMKQQKWQLSHAEAEMQAFGFNDIWVNFKQFIRQYGVEMSRL